MANAPSSEPAPDDEETAEARPVMVSFPMSEPLHYALKTLALKERTTVKAMMMRALKAIGLEVPDDELTDRRSGRSGRPKGSR